MKTIQETFDTVVKHFKQMKGPALDPVTELCLYRAPHGNKCFVGALIPDDKYNSKMEGESPDGPHVLPVLNALDYNMQFVSRLQSAHDMGARLYGQRDPERWRSDVQRRLESLALAYGIEMPIW